MCGGRLLALTLGIDLDSDLSALGDLRAVGGGQQVRGVGARKGCQRVRAARADGCIAPGCVHLSTPCLVSSERQRM